MSRSIQANARIIEGNKLHTEIKALHGRLVITSYQDQTVAFLIQNDQLIAIHDIPESDPLSSIYIGRVKDIVPNLGAMFVQISESETCFLKQQNIPDDLQNIKVGQCIPVKKIAEAQKNKRASVTAKINWKQIPEGEDLSETWKFKSAFTCIYKGRSRFHELLGKQIDFREYEEIVTDIEDIYFDLKDYPILLKKSIQVRYYSDPSFPLSKLYSLQTKAEDAYKRQIWLKSGGYLLIDYTEAFHIIDVNSGRFEISKSYSKEEYIQQTNLEALQEVARQMRLRNLSGMILVDLINMSDDRTKNEMITSMQNFTQNDVCRVEVLDITALGILEMTRKKKWKPFRELFSSNLK